MNVLYCFGEFDISSITDEFRDYIVDWRTFWIRKSLCIPIKYPAILVSFPLNRPMFFLWKSWYLYLNMEWGLWYIPEPKILYIILWAEIIWFTMGISETTLKNNDQCTTWSFLNSNKICPFLQDYCIPYKEL